MNNNHTIYILATLISAIIIFFGSCKGGNSVQNDDTVPEDVNAKKMLQGVWVSEDDGEPVFRALNDTLYYPDESAEPTAFQIINDTLIIAASHPVKYAIISLGANSFRFINAEGDKVQLIRSTNSSDTKRFVRSTHSNDSINQGKLIKRDSIFLFNEERYHAYIQVNPTTYKVYKQTVNSDGVTVDNAYYDNIINVTLYNGSKRIYRHDFRKDEFSNIVPETYIKSSILSDITLKETNANGIVFEAILTRPDTYTSYHINITITGKGKITMAV